MYLKEMVKGLPAFSNFVLGCDHYDETTPLDIGLFCLDYYFDKGGNVLDTARSYGQERPGDKSRSEITVGNWIRQTGTRKKVVVVSKGGNAFEEKSRITPKDLKEDFAQTCEDLGFEPDIWLLHRDNPNLEVKEIVQMAKEAMNGSSSRLGMSNWSCSRLEEAMKITNVALSEIQYSLANCNPTQWGDQSLQCMTDSDRQWYKKTGLPVFCFSSQAKGLFYNLLSDKPLSEKAQSRFYTLQNARRAEKVGILSKELGVEPSAIVTAYIYSQEGLNAFPIVGATKKWQIEQTLSKSFLKLSSEDIAFLECD